MRTDSALEIRGPKAFDYEEDYVELERRYPDYYQEHGVLREKQDLLKE